MQTKNRNPLASSLGAITSEQINAYRKLYAEERKAREKLQAFQAEQDKNDGEKKSKKSGGIKGKCHHHFPMMKPSSPWRAPWATAG